MKKVIPFAKDIPFKSKISDITSISLDHDLSFENNLLIGNFYIKGQYRMTEASQIDTDYNYKIPFEITISDKYLLDEVSFDIEDFYYEVIDEEILRVNIEVYVDGLIEKKELPREEVAHLISLDKEDIRNQIDKESNDECDEEPIIEQETKEERDNSEKNVVKVEDVITNINSNNEEKYLTYSIYIFRENDTLQDIMEKYQINKEILSEYNNLDDVKIGSKLIIPSSNKNE